MCLPYISLRVQNTMILSQLDMDSITLEREKRKDVDLERVKRKIQMNKTPIIDSKEPRKMICSKVVID